MRNSYIPRFEQLEDRTVPSSLPHCPEGIVQFTHEAGESSVLVRYDHVPTGTVLIAKSDAETDVPLHGEGHVAVAIDAHRGSVQLLLKTSEGTQQLGNVSVTQSAEGEAHIENIACEEAHRTLEEEALEEADAEHDVEEKRAEVDAEAHERAAHLHAHPAHYHEHEHVHVHHHEEERERPEPPEILEETEHEEHPEHDRAREHAPAPVEPPPLYYDGPLDIPDVDVAQIETPAIADADHAGSDTVPISMHSSVQENDLYDDAVRELIRTDVRDTLEIAAVFAGAMHVRMDETKKEAR